MLWLTRSLLEEVLLEGRAGSRLLNESPVLLDVWEALGEPGEPVDLLLTPFESHPAARLAAAVHARVAPRERDRDSRRPLMRLAPLQGVVAVTVTRKMFLSVVLPLTGVDVAGAVLELDALVRTQPGISADGPTIGDYARFARTHPRAMSPDLRTALAVVLLWFVEDGEPGGMRIFDGFARLELGWGTEIPVRAKEIAAAIAPPESLIWRVSLNRPVERLGTSVETVKADAARRLFEVKCRQITWAVIDSGVDGAHPSFRDHEAGEFATRVDRALDFTLVRDLAAYDALLDDRRRAELQESVQTRLHLSPAEARALIARLAEDAGEGRPYDWDALSRLIDVPVDRPPAVDRGDGHGTHVAGVLAGDWRDETGVVHQGVCPDLRLYDLRVLGETEAETEFTVIAALEFVRWLNARNRFMTIHGVNLSIGLRHDMTTYACGQTPVCRAADATVDAGVVVVVAAGNWGQQDFQTGRGSYRGYAPISIADPGNAEGVITVGSTHRERPHEYGVSFFSSRGPTGDGRAKPDLVAPGERIDGPLPNLGFGRMDGTSMAAPHVSGAAALLLARHPELIGRPRRVKALLVDSATDLKRERAFQGAGLVDALRALQSL